MNILVKKGDFITSDYVNADGRYVAKHDVLADIYKSHNFGYWLRTLALKCIKIVVKFEEEVHIISDSTQMPSHWDHEPVIYRQLTKGLCLRITIDKVYMVKIKSYSLLEKSFEFINENLP